MSSTVIKMAYADTQHGQVHLRRIGEGAPLVLLHWAPASGRMYEGALPRFADRGFECFALDMPGYGRSHKNAFGWAMDRIAENVFEALDNLGVETFHLVGGHLSASLAAEMALQAPGRVGRLVLDGVLDLTEEEFSHLVAPFQNMSPMIKDGNDHASFAFEMTVKTLVEWNPTFQLSNETLPEVYDLFNDYLEMGFAPMRAFVEPESAPAPNLYPIGDRLERLKQRTLVISADDEPLSPSFERVVEKLPNGTGYRFPGLHPLVSQRGDEYAAVVSSFMNGSI